MFTLIRLFKPILMVMSLTVFSVVFSKGLAVTVTHTMTPLNLSAQAQYLKGDCLWGKLLKMPVTVFCPPHLH